MPVIWINHETINLIYDSEVFVNMNFQLAHQQISTLANAMMCYSLTPTTHIAVTGCISRNEMRISANPASIYCC
jgi:hypothetical protein